MTQTFPRPTRLSTILGTALIALGIAACRVEEGVSHETIAKPVAAPPAMKADVNRPAGVPTGDGANLPPGHPPLGSSAPAAPAAAPAGMPGMVGDVPPPPAVEEGAGLKWKLPSGWTETRSGGMRYATLRPGGDVKVDVSVIVLGGPAGGELANVNRWRGQIGLPPLDEAGLPSVRKVVKTKAGEVGLYDFTSEGTVKSRLVAGLLSANGSTWFVKMTGEATTVGAVRDDFGKILETLSF